jgi:glycosyltransferase involved in cell wall biosynthesis
LSKDIQEANLNKHVFFEKPRKDVEGFLSSMDVYASLGREDPYPLSVLEAGYFGKPVVCFDGTGGIPEFASRGAGIVVPYLSLDDFRDALLRLHREVETRKRLGAKARELVLEHHEMNSACDQIIEFVVRQSVQSPVKQQV